MRPAADGISFPGRFDLLHVLSDYTADFLPGRQPHPVENATYELEGWQTMLCTVKAGDVPQLRALAESGFDVNSPLDEWADGLGWLDDAQTALHHAALADEFPDNFPDATQLEMATALLTEFHADPNRLNQESEGENPPRHSAIIDADLGPWEGVRPGAG